MLVFVNAEVELVLSRTDPRDMWQLRWPDHLNFSHPFANLTSQEIEQFVNLGPALANLTGSFAATLRLEASLERSGEAPGTAPAAAPKAKARPRSKRRGEAANAE